MAVNRVCSDCDALPTMKDFIEILMEMDKGKDLQQCGGRLS